TVDELDALRAQIDSMQSRQDEVLENTQSRLAEVQLQLSHQAQRLRALSETTREDWLLAEAEYLLRLASQRILTERQTSNAITLMETADGILRDLDDSDLFAVRKALAAD